MRLMTKAQFVILLAFRLARVPMVKGLSTASTALEDEMSDFSISSALSVQSSGCQVLVEPPLGYERGTFETYRSSLIRLRLRSNGPIWLSFRPRDICLRYGQRSWALCLGSVVRTMLPLALLLTRLMVPVHVVYCSLDLMLLTMVRQSEGFRVGSISWRTTINWRSQSGWESGEFAGVRDDAWRLRWFLSRIWKIQVFKTG